MQAKHGPLKMIHIADATVQTKQKLNTNEKYIENKAILNLDLIIWYWIISKALKCNFLNI